MAKPPGMKKSIISYYIAVFRKMEEKLFAWDRFRTEVRPNTFLYSLSF